MIVKEFIELEDKVKLCRTYSDSFYKIKQVETGVIYDDAVDVEDAPYTYVETDILIENVNDDFLKARAYEILVGESRWVY